RPPARPASGPAGARPAPRPWAATYPAPTDPATPARPAAGRPGGRPAPPWPARAPAPYPPAAQYPAATPYRPAARSPRPALGPAGPRRYGAPGPAGTGPARSLPPVIDEQLLAAAPAWVTRAVTRAAERAAKSDARQLGGPPTGSRYGGPPAASSWPAPAETRPPLAGPYQRASRQRTARRRRPARWIWVLVLLFILFFNTVSSCIRTQVDNVTRNPAPTYEAPLPPPGK
ncbi:MAG TPA: hypothetical protein VMU51_18785, partial [Mycobacteriales bacterium]|nr:hypothetical protein [Mycobacteriales bacterium]